MIQWPCFRDMSSDPYVNRVLSLPNAVPKDIAWYNQNLKNAKRGNSAYVYPSNHWWFSQTRYFPNYNHHETKMFSDAALRHPNKCTFAGEDMRLHWDPARMLWDFMSFRNRIRDHAQGPACPQPNRHKPHHPSDPIYSEMAYFSLRDAVLFGKRIHRKLENNKFPWANQLFLWSCSIASC